MDQTNSAGTGVLLAPAATPADIVQKMNRTVDPVIKAPTTPTS